MPLRIKGGEKKARVFGTQPEMVMASMIVAFIWLEFFPGVECVVTEGSGGKHKDGSRHYVGFGKDYRIFNLPEPKSESVDRAAKEMRRRLGPDYDVIIEIDHIHVEFDPKH